MVLASAIKEPTNSLKEKSSLLTQVILEPGQIIQHITKDP